MRKERIKLTPQEKRLCIEEYLASDRKPIPFCKKYNISKATLYKWISLYNKHDGLFDITNDIKNSILLDSKELTNDQSLYLIINGSKIEFASTLLERIIKAFIHDRSN